MTSLPRASLPVPIETAFNESGEVRGNRTCSELSLLFVAAVIGEKLTGEKCVD
jgi:hypothetical protein